MLLDFCLSLVYFPAWIAAEVREREFSHWLGGFSEECVDQGSGMPEWPASRCLDEVYAYILACCLHRKPSLILWLLLVPLHPIKACIRMVTWTYPVLGDSLARCRIRSGVRRQWGWMVWLKLRMVHATLKGSCGDEVQDEEWPEF